MYKSLGYKSEYFKSNAQVITIPTLVLQINFESHQDTNSSIANKVQKSLGYPFQYFKSNAQVFRKPNSSIENQLHMSLGYHFQHWKSNAQVIRIPIPVLQINWRSHQNADSSTVNQMQRKRPSKLSKTFGRVLKLSKTFTNCDCFQYIGALFFAGFSLKELKTNMMRDQKINYKLTDQVQDSPHPKLPTNFGKDHCLQL